MSQDSAPLQAVSQPAPSQAESQPMAQRRVLSGVELKTLASKGGFAVDENTGNRMIQALQGVLDSLEARWSSLQQFQQRPPVSTTATAQWVAGHMLNTATDGQGLLTQLQQARAEFPTYIEAINLAKSNYREQDETTQTKLSSFDVGA
jgi:hypothetical protein